MTILCMADLRFVRLGATAKVFFFFFLWEAETVSVDRSVWMFPGADVKGRTVLQYRFYTTKTTYFVDNAISLGTATVT